MIEMLGHAGGEVKGWMMNQEQAVELWRTVAALPPHDIAAGWALESFACAVAAKERERWAAEAQKMADGWDDARPLDGTVSTALRELVRRVCVA